MNDKKPWDDEPTPQTDKESDSVWSADDGTCFERVHSDFARDLERRLRHAWKLVNSLRIDAMHDDREESNRSYMDIDELEQRLSDIEEVLTP